MAPDEEVADVIPQIVLQGLKPKLCLLKITVAETPRLMTPSAPQLQSETNRTIKIHALIREKQSLYSSIQLTTQVCGKSTNICYLAFVHHSKYLNPK